MIPIFSLLVFTTITILIMSFAIGMISGNPARGKQLVMWELKWLLRIGRWLLKETLETIEDVCRFIRTRI